MTQRWARLRAIPPGVIAALALALLVAILWLPFGLNVGFTGDDWIYFHQIKQGSIMSQATPTRLLWPIPYLMAYPLVPGQFASFNLFLALLFLCKGCLVYALLRRLNAGSALAFAAAALAVVFPADTSAFYMGALSIEFAVVAYLLAAYLLIVYWRTGRVSALLAMAIAQLGSVGMYELVYPLIAVTPLVLLWFRRKLDRRLAISAALWYVAPALYAGWYLLIVLNFPRAFQYQRGLMAPTTLSTILSSLLTIYRRHFFDGWFANLTTIPPAYLMLGLLAGALVFAVGAGLWRRQRAQIAPRPTLILALSGLAILFLGVALYLPTSVRDDAGRTYYFSSVGAALTLAALIYWAVRRPLICAALIGVFAGLGTAQLLRQHQAYDDISKGQQAMLTALVRALPQVDANTGIVIVDQSPDQKFEQVIGTLDIEDMVPLLYDDDSLEGALCLPADFGTAADARCRFTADGLVVPSVRTRYFVRPYDQLVLVRYDGQFSIVGDLSAYAGAPIPAYQPEHLYTLDAPLPARAVALFGL